MWLGAQLRPYVFPSDLARKATPAEMLNRNRVSGVLVIGKDSMEDEMGGYLRYGVGCCVRKVEIFLQTHGDRDRLDGWT